MKRRTMLLTSALVLALLTGLATVVSPPADACTLDSTVRLVNPKLTSELVTITGPCSFSDQVTVGGGQTVDVDFPHGIGLATWSGTEGPIDIARGETQTITLD